MQAKFAVVVAGFALLIGARPIVAHHSFSAEFDASKTFKFTGTVTKVEWMNPHTFFYIDVVDEKTKKVTNWAMEMGSPNGLMRNGWTRSVSTPTSPCCIASSRGRFDFDPGTPETR